MNESKETQNNLLTGRPCPYILITIKTKAENVSQRAEISHKKLEQTWGRKNRQEDRQIRSDVVTVLRDW